MHLYTRRGFANLQHLTTTSPDKNLTLLLCFFPNESFKQGKVEKILDIFRKRTSKQENNSDEFVVNHQLQNSYLI